VKPARQGGSQPAARPGDDHDPPVHVDARRSPVLISRNIPNGCMVGA
jgi:hypothetical protein